MEKIRLFWILVVFSCLPTHAERVNVEKAEKVAKSYAHITPRLAAYKNIHLSHTVSGQVKRNYSGLRSSSQEQEPLYYVFTLNDNGGFIIVSGDDVAKPVLGYSDEGTFDESNPNLAYWMETLVQEIAGAIEQNIPQDEQTKATWEALESETVVPLKSSGDYIEPLVQTRWNQNAPYNLLCPEQRYTGCVATTMAQIMKYHEYPTTRTVTIPGYTTRTDIIVVPAITGTTYYGWSNMLNTYTSSATDESKNAVATLMYHCGVSVEMNYKSSSSGAYSYDVVPALKTYFHYDAGMDYHDRDYYSYTEWINLLKTELKANRPVYYAGDSNSSGHAFVCDGYDSNNLFHFNWGWGGSSDGYFEVSALNPKSIGIGGGSGGYNLSQEIITGIQPDRGGNEQIRLGLSSVSTSKTSLTGLNQTFNVTAQHLSNIGIISIPSVYLGVLLCNMDDSYRDHRTSIQSIGLNPRYFYSSRTLISNYSLPSGLPVGTYKLYPAYSVSSGIPDIVPGKNGKKYILVEVNTGGNVTLSSAADLPELSLTSLKPVGNLYEKTTGYFEAEITNSGTADYHSNLSIRLGNDTVATEPVAIPAGLTKTIGFSGTLTLSPGNYSLSVWYDSTNTSEGTPSTQLGDAVSSVEVKAIPPGTPSLSLLSASFRNGNNAVPQNAPNLTIEISNADGLFNERITVYIYNTSGGTNIGSFGTTNVMIEKGETKSILFNNPIDYLTVGTRYMARVNHYNGGWKRTGDLIYFTVAPPITENTAIPVVEDKSTPDLNLYPNPFTDEVQLKGAKGCTLRIFSLSGALIHVQEVMTSDETIHPEHLQAGVYLFRLDKDGKTNTIWGVKK
ncbi:MAG: C10 family peptidase [Dysgonamonadaceae bacterium]|jgi:hypothetical protein|nr:C10 family peptidase [Dysgonamonadaceae bacterium]